MAQPRGKQFRGLPIPATGGKDLRLVLEAINRHLRSVPGAEPAISGSLEAVDNISVPQDGQVRKTGGLTDLPPVPHGTTVTWTFPTGTVVPATETLLLAGDYYQKNVNSTLTLRSDGQRYYEIGRAGNTTFIPASNWGVVPDTGVDMTAAIQEAFDSIQVGQTLFFEPGTYICSDSLLFAIAASIYAYGAIFDFGTTDLSATGYALRIGNNSTTDRTQQCHFEGLKVKRTYGTTVASLLYIGIDWCALIECDVANCWAEGFEQGHFVHGGVGVEAGNAYNNYRNLKITDCRYGIDIVDGGASAPNGWSNENNYIGGRCHLSSAITDETPGTPPLPDPPGYTPPNCVAIRIRYLGVHAPNNNRFYGITLEGQWGRKIYCEGLDNWFEACRYENSNTVADIEFYDPASAGQYGSRNTVLGGYKLEEALVKPPSGSGSNYDGSGRTVSLNKILASHRWDIRGGEAGSIDAAVRISNSTDTDDALQIQHQDGTWALGLNAQNGTTYNGALVWRDPTTGAPLLYFRMKLGTPNQLVVSDASGTDVGVIYINASGDFVLQNALGNTATKGVVDIIGGHSTDTLVPGLQMRHYNTSASTAAQVATSGGAWRIGFVAEAGGSILGKIDFESGAAASEVVRNSISMESGSPYKLQVHNGLRLNSADTSAGDVIWLDGTGSVAEGLKLNASTARVQVGGGAAPATTDGRLVTSGLKVQGRMDIATSSSGSSPLTVGIDDCYIGLTAATMTVNLPAVANVSDGHMIIIKDEGTAGGHTIDGSGAETIDGAATKPLGALGAMRLLKRNGAWWTI